MSAPFTVCILSPFLKKRNTGIALTPYLFAITCSNRYDTTNDEHIHGKMIVS